jgi:hypothetical protein
MKATEPLRTAFGDDYGPDIDLEFILPDTLLA